MENLKQVARQDYYTMLFAWLNHTGKCFQHTVGPSISCSDLHEHTSCLREILRKYENVLKHNWSFYLVLHVLPFILFKLRKMKDKSTKERWSMLLRLVKGYCGSIMFMGSFVAVLKTVCCLVSTLQSKNIGTVVN